MGSVIPVTSTVTLSVGSGPVQAVDSIYGFDEDSTMMSGMLDFDEE